MDRTELAWAALGPAERRPDNLRASAWTSRKRALALFPSSLPFDAVPPTSTSCFDRGPHDGPERISGCHGKG